MESEDIIIQKEKIEISPKMMGKDFKKFIKTNSEDYLERLKAEIFKNFKQQKELSDQMQEKNKDNDEINNRLSRRKQILLLEKQHKYISDLKLKAFMSLYKNMIEQKEENKKMDLINKIMIRNKKKKIFRALKNLSFFQGSKDYDKKLKNIKQIELQKLYENHNNQKQQLLLLISQAKEKLKHENRKKVQVKLMLDQMVLRGISALNMEAMKLSQNSLKDVVKCDYKKEFDAKYNSMLFPDSKATFVNSMK